eukprot:3102873-Amphidinium_carterae.1
MRGGGTAPKETEDLMDAIPTDAPLQMLMTVQDGKLKLQVDPRAKRLLQACGGVGKRLVASLQSGVPQVSYEASQD